MTSLIPDPSGTATWCTLLAGLGRPLLTWYGTARIELSGPVLARWFAKTDNYLAEEFPFGGAGACLALPLSWQRLMWEAALRIRGWSIEESDADTELIVSDDLDLLTTAAAAGQVAIAHTLAPLALAWPGELPGGVMDGIGELMGRADQVLHPEPGQPLPLSDLDASASDRFLLTTREPDQLLFQTLSAWRVGASVLVVDDPAPEAIRRIAAQEGASRVFG